MKKIRMVHVITRLVPGGAARVVQNLLLGLPKDQFEVLLICGTEEMDLLAVKEMSQKGIDVIVDRHLVRRVSPLHDLFCFFKLWKFFLNWKPDAVHSHTSKAGIVARFAACAAGVRHIFHTPHGHIYRPGSEIEGVPRLGFALQFLKMLETWANQFSEKIVTLTYLEKEDAAKIGLAHKEKMVPIYNGIDPEDLRSHALSREAARKQWNIPSSAYVVGVVGRFSRVKGHLEFVKAAKWAAPQDPSLLFVLAGEGPEEESLCKFVEEENLKSQIQFWGFQENVGNVFPALDVLVMPSLYEGFGLSVLEAWAFQLPVIATRVGGLVEVIEEGVSGTLVPPADPETLGRAILDLRRDPARAKKQGWHGYEKLNRMFTLQVMIQSYLRLYQECLSHSR